MTYEIKIRDRGRKQIEKRLASLEQRQTLAGVQGAEARRRHPGSKASVGEVAKFVHFGTDKMRARRFLDVAVANIRLRADAVRLLADLVARKPTRQGLDAIETTTVRAVQDGMDAAGVRVVSGALRGSVTAKTRRR